MDAFLQTLRTADVRVSERVPLSGCSTFRIGGPARYLAEPVTTGQLILCLQTANRFGIPYLVIGNGSNLLFADAGYAGVVILTGGVREIRPTKTGFYATAGVKLASLAVAARGAGLTGLEFAHGIPGTVGGAVLMNAGAYGSEMKEIVSEVEFYRVLADERITIPGTAAEFGYRTSLFAKDPDSVILGASVRLSPGDPAQIGARMEELAARRRQSQPLEFPSAGSVFKRPEGHFAGKLIEDCGLKGLRIGGAEVSLKHAGFIVNRGGATAADIRELIAEIQSRVFRETGVKLEPEIRFIGT